MIKKLKDIRIYGLIFTIASAVFVIGFSSVFFTEERLAAYQWGVGIDSMGALICAALFYGARARDANGMFCLLPFEQADRSRDDLPLLSVCKRNARL